MVQRDTPWPAGTPCWVDLGTDDVARARVFYETLFGWDTQVGPPESGGYVMCEIDGRPVAGLGPKMGPPRLPPRGLRTWPPMTPMRPRPASGRRAGR